MKKSLAETRERQRSALPSNKKHFRSEPEAGVSTLHVPTGTGRCMSASFLAAASIRGSDATDDAFSSAFYINLDRRVDRRAVRISFKSLHMLVHISSRAFWQYTLVPSLHVGGCCCADLVCLCVCARVRVCARACPPAWGFVLTDSTWSLSCGGMASMRHGFRHAPQTLQKWQPCLLWSLMRTFGCFLA